ncbi:MAG: hypothetical protein H7328_06155 [Bdellovibrio sp.]|nr:hypothetical protein [Bdellovibrio sp.]
MTTVTNKLQTGLQIFLYIFALALISSCSPTKSNPTDTSSNTSVVLSAEKTLAQCNRSTNTNMTFNTAVPQNSNGTYSSDVIKMKFSYLSVAATASGNTIRFFKWRVLNGSADLDSTPLNIYAYNISTGQSLSNAATSYPTAQIGQAVGFYIQLNDPAESYQVIKAVVYDTNGAIVSNMNSLIPAFYASPADYQFNSDGTARSSTLQALHPLNSQIAAGLTPAQSVQTLNTYCF